MTYAIGVVAHVDRLQMAEDLSAQVEANFMSIDPGHVGAGANHRLVWSVLSDLETDWTVVLEEDAVPVPEFRSQLTAALAAAPTDVLSIYLGRLRPPQWQARIGDALAKAQANEAHWITSTHCLHAVGLAVKTHLVPDMLANLKIYLPVDQAIGRWARSTGHTVAYSTPSLVDHADGPTLIQHPDGRPRVSGRVAWGWGQRTQWGSKSVPM